MAKARVNAPSLPINIDNIIINFPFVVNSCVSPRDSPTVLNAETDSKIMSIMGAFSVMLNRKAEITTTITENAKTTRARLRTRNGILRLKITIRFWPVIIAPILAQSIPRVVVLIPPPVDPGDAPINISIIIISIDELLSAAKSTVLNPLERAVTELKNAVNALFHPFA